MNGSNVLSSIAKRAAVTPYHSPLYTFYMFYTAKILCTLCALCASTPLRLNSPLFLSYVGPQSPLVRLRTSRPPLYSLLCSLVNRSERYFVAAAIYDRASIPTYINQGVRRSATDKQSPLHW